MSQTPSVVDQSEVLNENQAPETTFDHIDTLQQYNINAADITKLRNGGISTVMAVLQGLSEVKVEKIKEAAQKCSKTGFLTAAEVAKKRESICNISTGSKAFDAILGAGVQSQAITEVYGEFRTGKTQLCHTACVTVQLPQDMGGASGKAAYIDTEGTFRPDRIRSIAARFNMDEEAALDNITVARAFNSEQQMDLLNTLAAKMADEGGIYRLVVVDSILALFRTDYSGRGELSERQQKLNQHLTRLIRLAEEFNVAILISNHVQADPGAMTTFAAADKKPVGGHVLGHASTTRIYLRKGRGNERIAKLSDSPDLPETEATYALGVGGIEEA
ncbi:hypothetical protein E3P77_00801 [Wallemia ichthyophaga]|uniref:Meiotic recombination protein DMC1 n=2 Tax=Wallemia ichthyophaga TaxID=245174 RepID=A0A4T0KCN0_WALIC|nr:Meiotic recombination protein DLH1 [Wallemia ichthyophaga EXF-994]TIA73748.1 hypothetical protein E3P91_01271 [Wallemia ichthyophaga]EOR01152.1 Meiotic recombination protein DLH1 [Wallemia ichthyophaga EXF-994]TIA83291.1 hypothetical protein E3P98_00852 [Wallemia ichthyophaga]TIA92254.1 hypothetical protein E3P97_01580 [Wallemia ichthyophaga]TIA99572.1 hypothetical protein E3P95_02027 [Wallemia ichthyophaga]